MIKHEIYMSRKDTFTEELKELYNDNDLVKFGSKTAEFMGYATNLIEDQYNRIADLQKRIDHLEREINLTQNELNDHQDVDDLGKEKYLALIGDLQAVMAKNSSYSFKERQRVYVETRRKVNV